MQTVEAADRSDIFPLEPRARVTEFPAEEFIRAFEEILQERAEVVGPEHAEREVLRAIWKIVAERGAFSFDLYCRFFVRITTKEAGTVVPFQLNEIQRQFCAARTGRDVVLKARQVGLTTLELARDAWFCQTVPNSRVVAICAPDKASENVKKIVDQVEFMLGAQQGVPVKYKIVGRRVEFDNGSVLVLMDGGGTEKSAVKVGRGGTYHRVHITELAFFPYPKKMLSAIDKALPPLEKGSECTIESTPNGVGGEFYQRWQGAVAGVNGFTPHFYGWFWMDEYRIGSDAEAGTAGNDDEAELIAAAREVGVVLTEAQLRWWRQERERSGIDETKQEFPHEPVGCFLMSGKSYFGRDGMKKVNAGVKPHLSLIDLVQRSGVTGHAQPYVKRCVELSKLWNRYRDETPFRVWEPPQAGHHYVIAVDTAGGGTRGDWLVAHVLDQGEKTHVATLRMRVKPSAFARNVHALALAYGSAMVVVESNNHGGTVIHVLHEELKYPYLWKQPSTDEIGWNMHPTNRTPIIDDLVDAFMLGEFASPDAVFATECSTFIINEKTGKIEASTGCNDDTVMAMAIGLRVLFGPRARRGVAKSPAPFG